MLNRDQIDFLLTKAYNASLRAGARIIDIYTGSDNWQVDFKSDMTPIILADREAHNVIKEYLGQTRIPLLSEEGRDLLFEERCNWDLFWIVDPLDGTKEFLKGNGEFTVNIALMYENKPVIGIIYVPYINKIYIGVKGYGSFVGENVMPDEGADFDMEHILTDLKRLPLRKEINNPPKIAVSRSHNTQETFEIIDRFKQVYPDAEIVEQGSSYKLCMIAEATVDYYVRTTFTYEWDTAAGEIIMNEADALIEPFEGGSELQYNKQSLQNPFFICRSKFLVEQNNSAIKEKSL